MPNILERLISAARKAISKEPDPSDDQPKANMVLPESWHAVDYERDLSRPSYFRRMRDAEPQIVEIPFSSQAKDPQPVKQETGEKVANGPGTVRVDAYTPVQSTDRQTENTKVTLEQLQEAWAKAEFERRQREEAARRIIGNN